MAGELGVLPAVSLTVALMGHLSFLFANIWDFSADNVGTGGAAQRGSSSSKHTAKDNHVYSYNTELK